VADIDSGAAFDRPNLLQRFVMVSFGDLKKYKFTYWCAFPALTFPSAHQIQESEPAAPLGNVFSSSQVR